MLEGTRPLVHVAGCVGHVVGKPEVGHSLCFAHTGERMRGEGCLRGVCPTHDFTLGDKKELFDKHMTDNIGKAVMQNDHLIAELLQTCLVP